MERGFRPRGPERRERRKGEEGVRGPEVRGSEEGVKGPEVRRITIEIGEKCYGFILPPEVFEKGGKVKVTTPEGVVFEVEVGPSEEFLKRVKEYQEKSEEHRKTTEEAVEALKEKLEVPPEILEKVKEIFRDVKSHLPEIPEILRELEEKLKELEEELNQAKSEKQKINLERQINLEIQIKRLKITIGYLRRLQEIAQQIEEGTVPSNIRERLRKDEGFGQAIKKIAELFNALKGEEDIYKRLELIFPDEKERKEFLDNVRQGQISLADAINLMTGTILRTLEREGIRVDKYPLERWVKPLLAGIALDVIDRIKQKLEQEQKPPTPEAQTGTVGESFQTTYEAAKTNTPEGLRARVDNRTAETINVIGELNNEIHRIIDLSIALEKRRREIIAEYIKDRSKLDRVKEATIRMIGNTIRETRKSVENNVKSIYEHLNTIIKNRTELESQIRELEERLSKGELSRENFENELKKLEDDFNKSLNEIKGKLGEIGEVLRERLMTLKLLENTLGILEPEEKEEKEKKEEKEEKRKREIMTMAKGVSGSILKGILKGLKGGGELLLIGGLLLLPGALLALIPGALKKLEELMRQGL